MRRAAVPTAIASGREPTRSSALAAGEPVGTLLVSTNAAAGRPQAMAGRPPATGRSSGARCRRGQGPNRKSLLPIGVTAMEGRFRAGRRSPARQRRQTRIMPAALASYGSGEARLIARKSTGEICEELGYVDGQNHPPRDNLILLVGTTHRSSRLSHYNRSHLQAAELPRTLRVDKSPSRETALWQTAQTPGFSAHAPMIKRAVLYRHRFRIPRPMNNDFHQQPLPSETYPAKGMGDQNIDILLSLPRNTPRTPASRIAQKLAYRVTTDPIYSPRATAKKGRTNHRSRARCNPERIRPCRNPPPPSLEGPLRCLADRFVRAVNAACAILQP